VDAVAGAEDVRLHPRVPAVGLVAEVGTGFDQLLHGYDGSRHNTFLSGLNLWEAGTVRHIPLRNRYRCFPCGFAMDRGNPRPGGAPLTRLPEKIQP
jgi:hypothetical protein